MKRKFVPILACVSMLISSCTTNTGSEPSQATQSQNVASTTASGNVITYNVYLKPQDFTDADADELYKDFSREQFVDSVFSAIYYHKAKISDINGNALTLEDVKSQEIENPNFSRDKLAGLQITEEWQFNPEALTFNKKVKKVLFGYEVVQDSMIIALRPGFVIEF